MTTEVVRPKRGGRMMDICVRDSLVDWVVGSRGADKTKVALCRELDEVAADLAGPDPTPVERTLAETAALCWFALRYHEALYAAPGPKDGSSLKECEYYQRRIDRAHRRFLETLKTLATVRRLAVPSLQINLARRQLNLSGPLSLGAIEAGH